MSQHGIYAYEGTETLLTLDATKFNTNERTYPIDAPNRNCYLDGEFDLKYTPYDLGFVYTLDNCQINAYVDVVVKNCSCLPPMIFADHNETVLNSVPWLMKYKVKCERSELCLQILHALNRQGDDWSSDNWSFRRVILLTTGLLDNLVFWTTDF